MNNHCRFLMALMTLGLCSGCLVVKEYRYKFDYETGLFQVDYHKIRDEKEASNTQTKAHKAAVELLRKALEKKDDYDPDVVSVISKTLFPDNGDLSGKAIFQVKCPKCFPSRVEILRLLLGDSGSLQIINDEIFLSVPRGDKTLACGKGQLLKTEKNLICVWSQEEKHFDVRIISNDFAGVSLLEEYLAEQQK